ncbi:MAG: hypothetical protein IJ333_05105 [Clostridia bacterium]|nr:hypothetical protein [Clostridia bacterium]
MKSSVEMTENVLRRSQAYRTRRSKRIKMICTLLGCFGLVLLIGGGLWLRGLFPKTVQISALLPALTETQLAERSHLIVKGTVEGRSQPFQVKPVGGGMESNFMDYYLTIEEVYRGNAEIGEKIAVRVEGGTVGALTVISELDPELHVEDTVFLYLYQTNTGGGYTTGDDYYLVQNGWMGAYHFKEDPNRPINQKSGDSFDLTEKAAFIAKINETTPVNENSHYEQILEAFQHNLNSGFMTQEEYDREIANLKKYASVTKRG